MISLGTFNLGRRFIWQSRSNANETTTGSSLAERLDRYVTSIEQSKVETTARERMALRARLETAFDR